MQWLAGFLPTTVVHCLGLVSYNDPLLTLLLLGSVFVNFSSRTASCIPPVALTWEAIYLMPLGPVPPVAQYSFNNGMPRKTTLPETKSKFTPEK